MTKLGVKVKKIVQVCRLSHSRTYVLTTMIYCLQLKEDDFGSCLRRGARGRRNIYEFINWFEGETQRPSLRKKSILDGKTKQNKTTKKPTTCEETFRSSISRI